MATKRKANSETDEDCTGLDDGDIKHTPKRQKVIVLHCDEKAENELSKKDTSLKIENGKTESKDKTHNGKSIALNTISEFQKSPFYCPQLEVKLKELDDLISQLKFKISGKSSYHVFFELGWYQFTIILLDMESTPFADDFVRTLKDQFSHLNAKRSARKMVTAIMTFNEQRKEATRYQKLDVTNMERLPNLPGDDGPNDNNFTYGELAELLKTKVSSNLEYLRDIGNWYEINFSTDLITSQIVLLNIVLNQIKDVNGVSLFHLERPSI